MNILNNFGEFIYKKTKKEPFENSNLKIRKTF